MNLLKPLGIEGSTLSLHTAERKDDKRVVLDNLKVCCIPHGMFWTIVTRRCSFRIFW